MCCNCLSLLMISNLSYCNEPKQLVYILFSLSQAAGDCSIFCNLLHLQRRAAAVGLTYVKIFSGAWLIKDFLFIYLSFQRVRVVVWRSFINAAVVLSDPTRSALLWTGAADVCSLMPCGLQPNWSQSWCQLKKKKKKKTWSEGRGLHISSPLMCDLDLVCDLLTSHFPDMRSDQ